VRKRTLLLLLAAVGVGAVIVGSVTASTYTAGSRQRLEPVQFRL
jgi:hypothetical protein